MKKLEIETFPFFDENIPFLGMPFLDVLVPILSQKQKHIFEFSIKLRILLTSIDLLMKKIKYP